MSELKGIKTILVGESTVGKTNLIRVATGDKFLIESTSTMASSFLEHKIDYNDKKYTLCLWDTVGQERFRALNKLYIKEAKIALVVFAINNKESFNEVDFWLNYIKEILGKEKYVMALIANKSDLYEDQEVSDEEIVEKANQFGIRYAITSAKTDADGFKQFLRELFIDYINLIGPEAEGRKTFKLDKPTKKEEEKKCPC